MSHPIKWLCCFMVMLLASDAEGQSFHFPSPEGWRNELMTFPIGFAPKINYTGEEHLRFHPNWGDTQSEYLWSYIFLWWIEGDAKISKESLENELQDYYAGLVGRNIISRKIDSAKVVPTVASFKQVDKLNFIGTIHMLDYMNLQPLKLNVEVNIVTCTKEGKLAVFFGVSPLGAEYGIWQVFKGVRHGFRCEK